MLELVKQIKEEQVEGIEKLFDFYIRNEKDDPTSFQLYHSIQCVDWKDGELDYSGVWSRDGWILFYNESLEILMDTYWESKNKKYYQYDRKVKNRLNMLIELRKNWNMSLDEYKVIYD